MSAIPSDKLDKVVQRWEEIQADLNRGVNPATYAQLTKEFADLSPVVETVQNLRKLEGERNDLIQLLNDPASAKDFKDFAQQELGEVDSRLAQVQEKLRVHLLPKDAADEKSAILEVRAGNSQPA